ncbi:hypothetical protein ALP29_200338 [Pseudomonas syringae pv. avii]|uniref:Uncharacterized protein n=1 Tax=Pseudomonas syringae pv. avii TaxID=663959 RepID=A0A3M5U188_PSESX|nr:hypothetical protein ALP29_200338 [Pseudomonas syringae pv. avii]
MHSAGDVQVDRTTRLKRGGVFGLRAVCPHSDIALFFKATVGGTSLQHFKTCQVKVASSHSGFEGRDVDKLHLVPVAGVDSLHIGSPHTRVRGRANSVLSFLRHPLHPKSTIMQLYVAFAFQRIDTRDFTRRQPWQVLSHFERAQQTAHFGIERTQGRWLFPENRNRLDLDSRVDRSGCA